MGRRFYEPARPNPIAVTQVLLLGGGEPVSAGMVDAASGVAADGRIRSCPRLVDDGILVAAERDDPSRNRDSGGLPFVRRYPRARESSQREFACGRGVQRVPCRGRAVENSALDLEYAFPKS